MQIKDEKLLIICGPTATGKTRLGIELAKKFDGEIVSADSRQVYRGMDIGTGKDIRNFKFEIQNFKSILNIKFEIGYYDIDGIKVWLLDVVDPDYKFNVADYKKCADVVLDDIWKRGKLPIIVGGTGFYIKAIVDGIGTIGVEPDWELRKELSNCQINELRITLERLDVEKYQAMNESDRQNPRRLIRAIEIARKFKVQNSKCKIEIQSSKFDTLFIGLRADYKFLYQRIDQRVDERVKNGIENEIRGLLNKGCTWGNSALGSTLAYSQWEPYFGISRVSRVPQVSQGETREEVIQRWKFDEHNYARRQMTWFKKDKRIEWFNIENNDYPEKVEKLVESWYI